MTEKDARGRKGHRTISARRPYSVIFPTTHASSCALVIPCRTPRFRDHTPVVGERAGETVASRPNQVFNLLLRTSSRIPSRGSMICDTLSCCCLPALEEGMIVAVQHDAVRLQSAGPLFPFRSVRDSLCKSGSLVSAAWYDAIEEPAQHHCSLQECLKKERTWQ